MKKVLAYVATAVLLGFAVIMLPLTMQIGSSAFRSPLSPTNPQFMDNPAEDATKGADFSVLLYYGLAKDPANLLPPSLVLFSGLIVALTVYVILKRRMP